MVDRVFQAVLGELLLLLGLGLLSLELPSQLIACQSARSSNVVESKLSQRFPISAS